MLPALEQGILDKVVGAGGVRGQRQREGAQGRDGREQAVAELRLDRLAAGAQRLLQLLDQVGEAGGEHLLADPIMRHKAERRPGTGPIGRAAPQHDGVQVDAVLIDQAEFGEAVR